ncbi:MAG: ABC transporter ATP-binding protein [Chloroflexi bacterium]|nr:ABC transporter ATP-binding protein [Chloroflexota bacterium]
MRGGGAGWRMYLRGDEEEVKRTKVTWPLLKRVLRYALPYRKMIILMLLAVLLSTGLSLLTPLIFRDLIDNTLPNGNTSRLNLLALALVLIPFVNGLLAVMQRYLNASVGEGVIYDLRVQLYSHLQRMSLRFFTNTKTGELMSRLNNDVVDAQRAISSTITDIITNLIQVIAVLGVMFTLEWRLTLLGLVVLPIFVSLARRLGGRLRQIAREAMDYNAAMNAIMNETLNIGGVLLVKLFGRNTVEIERFEHRSGQVRDIGVRRAVVGSQFFIIIGLVGAIGTALVYWIGGHLVLRGVFTIGTIVAFSSYLAQLYGVLQQLTNAPVAFATSMVSFERVFEVIDLPYDVPEKPDAVVLDQVQGALSFEDVTFAYSVEEANLLSSVTRHGDMSMIGAVLSGDNKQSDGGAPAAPTTGYSQAREIALEDISFSIEPGRLVALVGPSGAGKTTITYLIPRLYDPTEGRILLDGHDLRDVSLNSLAAQVGMVTQETHLFHDTIRTNLLYARLDATQAEVEAAARAANIHDFIASLPNGYDTVVGERGYRLSGGEKQRLAIARVILKNPRILVLDEATSHLDSQSEALIQDALKTVMAGRTSIVIAHRLSTILAADLILVLDRGRIVERGTHAELLARGGLYAQLYETQFSHDHHDSSDHRPIISTQESTS